MTRISEKWSSTNRNTVFQTCTAEYYKCSSGNVLCDSLTGLDRAKNSLNQKIIFGRNLLKSALTHFLCFSKTNYNASLCSSPASSSLWILTDTCEVAIPLHNAASLPSTTSVILVYFSSSTGTETGLASGFYSLS